MAYRGEIVDYHKLEAVTERGAEDRLELLPFVERAHGGTDRETVFEQILDDPPSDEAVGSGD